MHRLLAILALVSLFVTPTSTQAPATLPACDGDFTLVRISEIKPGSSLAAFMQAQDAHIAWYRKNGFQNNRIYATRILVPDPATKALKYSDTEIMSFHSQPPGVANSGSVASKDQAGWDAYVKMYSDVSTIKSTQMICMPKNR